MTAEGTARRRIEWTTAAELAGKVFADPRWAVRDIVPEGLTILAGPPKIGKSWLTLGMAVSVASGGRALGTTPVEPGDVAYLALEDTPRRMQARLRKICPDGLPAAMSIAYQCPPLDQGGLMEMDGWLAAHGNARLVIVDTLAKVRPRRSANGDRYSEDYAAIAPLKAVADKYGVAMIVVHHTRKAAAADPHERISGTEGLRGAADTTLVLTRARGQHDATLSITGRDVEERDLALKWDSQLALWSVLGAAGQFAMSPAQRKIVDAVALLGPATPKVIADYIGANHEAVKKAMQRLAKDGHVKALCRGLYGVCGDKGDNQLVPDLVPAILGV